MQPPASAPLSSPFAYHFGQFRLVPDRRELLVDDAPVKLGGRAFDMLVALVLQHGRVLSKNELLDLVWPRLVVEENNLQVQVMALRRLLGHGAIATVPGRGYRFVLPVRPESGGATTGVATTAHGPQTPEARLTTESAETPPARQPGAAAALLAATAASAATGASGRKTNLPLQTPPLFGRTDDVAALAAQLVASVPARLLTVAGAGGIGKTRLAQAAAEAVLPAFPDGVWWVELAALTDGAALTTAVAQAIGLRDAGGPSGGAAVLACLQPLHLLLVLDNCEHLLEPVAMFVERLLAGAPGLQVMLTSQEVLRAPQESVYRVGTLSLAADASPAALAASGSGALFVARAHAADRRFAVDDGNSAAIADICRRLDGIPLAIELAAARVPLLGVEGVRGRLNERFKVLTAGARAVMRRHQTLRAALEWSHALLSPPEQAVFRRLGVFAGSFTLEAAQNVADDDTLDGWEVLEHLGALVDKSLVMAEGDPLPRYRMLETTRLYALECLAGAGETDTLLRRHAEAMVQLLAVYDARRYRTSGDDWVRMAAEVDNIRAALGWSTQAARDGSDADAALLALDVASHSAYVFLAAGLTGEGFACLCERRAWVSPEMPRPKVAMFWLWLAKIGSLAGHAESLDAARRADRLYAEIGDDERRYDALHVLVSIAALRGDALGLEQALADARAIEQPHWPPRLRANLCFAEHRLRQLQGRSEDALACLLEQGRLVVEGGLVAESTIGPSAADCEIALGRLDAAERRARAALALIDDAPLARMDAAYALDTLTVVLTLQGRHDEAVACGRRARRLLQLRGADFRLLGTLALNAALQG